MESGTDPLPAKDRASCCQYLFSAESDSDVDIPLTQRSESHSPLTKGRTGVGRSTRPFHLKGVHTHMHTHTYTHNVTHAHTHTCTCTYTHTHIHTHTHTYTHAHTNTHMHACTHTHSCVVYLPYQSCGVTSSSVTLDSQPDALTTPHSTTSHVSRTTLHSITLHSITSHKVYARLRIR